MRLGGVKPGDIVNVSDGLGPWLAIVVGVPTRHRVPVQAIAGSKHRRQIGARDVCGHWRRATGTPMPASVTAEGARR